MFQSEDLTSVSALLFNLQSNLLLEFVLPSFIVTVKDITNLLLSS